MLRLVIDSIEPPYTMLFRMSHFFTGTPGKGVTCVVREAIGLGMQYPSHIFPYHKVDYYCEKLVTCPNLVVVPKAHHEDLPWPLTSYLLH